MKANSTARSLFWSNLFFARGITFFDEDEVNGKHIYEGRSDEKVVVVSKLGFLATGSVRGKQVKRFDMYMPNSDGYTEEHADQIELFYLEKPLYEEDYRTGVLHDHDVLSLQ
jgi:hypothetical protein